jgi:hypothetical protein
LFQDNNFVLLSLSEESPAFHTLPGIRVLGFGLDLEENANHYKDTYNRVNQGRRLKEDDHAQTPSVDEETIKKVRKVAIDPGVGV